MRASQITDIIQDANMKGPDIDLTGIRANSAGIRPGEAFIALKGSITDGHLYINDAIKAGAQVIICSKGSVKSDLPATTIEVPDTKKALEHLLPIIYPQAGKPSLIGITGTNGKTTITYIIESILTASGKTTGVLGTINTRYPGTHIESDLTTPGPLDLFETLHAMGLAGVDICVMEASSHALDQDRMAGLKYDCGIFTNLSQDHLDYHSDMELYFLSKNKLFHQYLNGPAVINIDDPYGRRLCSGLEHAVTYGRSEKSTIRLTSLHSTPSGLSMDIATPQGTIHIKSPLLGEINAYNIMAATGACFSMGIGTDEVIRGVQALKSVPGRMQLVENSHGLKIIIDYAHTPDALRKMLSSARRFTQGRLICIFGCGGNRDKGKRPIMGSIAQDLSDIIIITSDNPRTEAPDAIIKDILVGIKDGPGIFIEPDRALAIKKGIESMEKDDCMIVAGKGHEGYQIVGNTKKTFDDRIITDACLKEVFG